MCSVTVIVLVITGGEARWSAHLREKWVSSDLPGSNVIPSSLPHARACSSREESFCAFSVKEEEISSFVTSSAYRKFLPESSSESRGEMYSIKRIGETGESWESPQSIWVSGPISPSSQIQTRLSVAKEDTHRTRGSGQLCSRSLRTSRPGRTASKAPFTSRARTEATLT